MTYKDLNNEEIEIDGEKMAVKAGGYAIAEDSFANTYEK